MHEENETSRSWTFYSGLDSFWYLSITLWQPCHKNSAQGGQNRVRKLVGFCGLLYRKISECPYCDLHLCFQTTRQSALPKVAWTVFGSCQPFSALSDQIALVYYVDYSKEYVIKTFAKDCFLSLNCSKICFDTMIKDIFKDWKK